MNGNTVKNKRLESSYPSNNWQQVYNNLLNLYYSSYTFENLPDTVNERVIKQNLFDNGRVVFFKDEIMGYLALQGTSTGMLDVYGEPIEVTAIGNNGYSKILNNKDSHNGLQNCVIIYNNFTRTSDKEKLVDYAKKICLVERTIDENINVQKTPFILHGNKNTITTLKQVYKKLEEFEPMIITDENLNVDDTIQALNLNAPFLADKLELYKKQLWSEILSFIGIENDASEKKERITTSEIIVSNGLAISNRVSKLQEIVKGIDEVNELFGLDIKVKRNTDLLMNIDVGNEEKGERMSYGTVHDDDIHDDTD